MAFEKPNSATAFYVYSDNGRSENLTSEKYSVKVNNKGLDLKLSVLEIKLTFFARTLLICRTTFMVGTRGSCCRCFLCRLIFFYFNFTTIVITFSSGFLNLLLNSRLLSLI